MAMELVVGAAVVTGAGLAGATKLKELYREKQKEHQKYDIVIKIDSLLDLKKGKGWSVSYPVWEAVCKNLEDEKAKKDPFLYRWYKSGFSAPALESAPDVAIVNEELEEKKKASLLSRWFSTPAPAPEANSKEEPPLTAALQHPINSSQSQRAIVAVLGLFNRGKSYLLARLFEMDLDSSYFTHTEGLSALCSRSEMSETLIGIDTQGSNKAVIGGNEDSLEDAEATEKFLQYLAFEMSDVIVVVVDRLTRDDQKYISQLKNMAKTSRKATRFQQLIVVHNFSHVRQLDNLNTVIQQEIVGCCNATIHVKKENYWVEEDGTRHVVMAMDEKCKEGSPAGKEYNEKTIALLRTWLKSAAATALQSTSVVEKVIEHTNKTIGNFLTKQISVIPQYKGPIIDAIVLDAKSTPNIQDISYQKLNYNIIGIAERPRQDNPGKSYYRNGLFQDEKNYYVILDCPGFLYQSADKGNDDNDNKNKEEIKPLKISIVNETTLRITAYRPLQSVIAAPTTSISSDFPQETEKVEMTWHFPAPIDMSGESRGVSLYEIKDGVLYLGFVKRTNDIEVQPLLKKQ